MLIINHISISLSLTEKEHSSSNTTQAGKQEDQKVNDSTKIFVSRKETQEEQTFPGRTKLQQN